MAPPLTTTGHTGLRDPVPAQPAFCAVAAGFSFA